MFDTHNLSPTTRYLQLAKSHEPYSSLTVNQPGSTGVVPSARLHEPSLPRQEVASNALKLFG